MYGEIKNKWGRNFRAVTLRKMDFSSWNFASIEITFQSKNYSEGEND